MSKMYSGVIVVKQSGVRYVLIYPLSDILVEEMVVKFILKSIYFVTLYYRRWELIPLPYHVITEEKFCAV